MLFDQLITYQILLDFLYDSRKFGDLLRIYEVIRKRIIVNKQYVPSTINAIIFATYYRLVGAKNILIAAKLYVLFGYRFRNLWKFIQNLIRSYMYIYYCI